jgi:hypothetical protein
MELRREGRQRILAVQVVGLARERRLAGGAVG